MTPPDNESTVHGSGAEYVQEGSQTARERIRYGARLERGFILAGVVVVPILFIGQLLSGTFPPWDPEWSPDRVADELTTNETRKAVGFMIHTAGVCLFALWGAALTAAIYRMEAHRRPAILTFAHGILAAGNVVYFLLIPLAWSSAQYRAGDVSPEVTQSFTDFGWFMYLGTWPPFSLQAIVVALAVIEDQKNKRIFKSGRPVIWSSYAFAAVGLLSAPMGLAKEGPFAWDGVLALWVVLVVWSIWEFTVTWQLLVALSADERQKLAELDVSEAVGAPPSISS